jgi:hypothetical protein
VELFDSRIASAKAGWEAAAEIQRGKWLEQMDGVAIAMAPKNGAEPRRAFLHGPVSLLEPELRFRYSFFGGQQKKGTS